MTSALGVATSRRELLVVFASIGLGLQLAAHEVVVMMLHGAHGDGATDDPGDHRIAG